MPKKGNKKRGGWAEDREEVLSSTIEQNKKLWGTTADKISQANSHDDVATPDDPPTKIAEKRDAEKTTSLPSNAAPPPEADGKN